MGGVDTFLVFGSNIGDRESFLRKGIDMVSHLRRTKFLAVSGVYETEPVDVVDQPFFLNSAAEILTSLPPFELLTKLKEIEAVLGRIDRGRWREREIDIDIIFYGDELIASGELTIPHPKAHLRKFVLHPLNEIRPNHVHPVFHRTVCQLFRECPDSSEVVRIGEPLFQVN